MRNAVEATAQQMVAEGRGILAADESTPTIGKRLAAVDVASTDETRRTWRELLVTTPGLGRYISGIILYDETIRQAAHDGTPLVDLLPPQHIMAGIKVDLGTEPLAGFPDELVTTGLDGLTALAVVLPAGTAAIQNAGPHGFSEVLYAFTSATANNGSAFAGLSANTIFYNLALAIAMMIGRFAVVVPVLAIAGSLAAKTTLPPSAGTFPTTGGLFIGLLTGIILIVGGLTFFPALSLGPITEHLSMLAGTTY